MSHSSLLLTISTLAVVAASQPMAVAQTTVTKTPAIAVTVSAKTSTGAWRLSPAGSLCAFRGRFPNGTDARIFNET